MSWPSLVTGFFLGATALNIVWIVGLNRAALRQSKADK